MPFSKRIVEPQLLCRHAVPGDEGALFEDLRSVSSVALSRTLRQLSDLARHACSLFQELESELASTGERARALQGKIGSIQQALGALDPRQEAVPVSNLDVESKLTSHYQAPWHQQRNVFHPSTRPPCLEELHQHAKQNLRALHRDQHQQQQQQRTSSHERRVTISISVAPPMPTYPSPRTLRRREQRSRHLRTERPGKHVEYRQIQRKERPVRETEFQQMQRKFERKRSSSPIECCHFTPWSRKAPPPSDSDMDVVALGHRPRCPVPNIPSTLDKQTNWSRALPLPTPEERMKTESQVISSCIIPINITGAGFDREASARCSLVHSQSVLQRRRKLRRRKTISGIPRRVQQDLDSDESPVARERTVIVHTNPDFSLRHEDLTLSGRLNTKDSGCQTEDLVFTAPSRRRIRAQRGQGIPNSLSHSTGNITSLPDSADSMFTSVAGTRLRSRSLPREGGRLVDEGHDDSDDEELSPYEAEEFLPGQGERILKDEEESTDDQSMPEHQLVNLKQCTGSPDHTWTERGRSRFPRKIDMGSCEISSSSDTFSSPIHSVSTAGVLGSQMDHKEDHQSSSGNWSGSSSTCPSQTSETIPPAASPPLTGSSHCDSELSLNTALHATDDSAGFALDPYQTDMPQVQAHQACSFTSSKTNPLDPNIETTNDSEWNFLHHQHDKSCRQDFSPPHPRENEGGLECPSCTSMTTYESFTDKLSSEKTDSSSHYSIDTEGYYTSMHFDCGLKGSRNYVHDYAALGSDCDQSINVATRIGGYHQSDYHGTRTLGRHFLSLKKPKVKPAPPKRSSSLKKSAPDINEPKINSGQHLQLSSREKKLQLDLASSSRQLENPTFNEEPVESWVAKNVVEMTHSTLFSPTDTHSFKGEGAVQSDYADLWLLNDLKSNDPYRSLSNSSTATGTTVIECIKSPESSESHTSQSGSRATTPSLPSVENEFKLASPEKLAGLASPSSGYSSQSETPTSSFPSAFFPGPLSPTSGKRKPKVPERKSSLSSLQQQQLSRDGSISKRDLELPIIPPTHLDLSALHTVLSKPSAHRNQIHILHQNKQKASTVAKLEASGSLPMAITPTVLRSVHLRSIGRPAEGGQEQHGSDARPKCPTVTVVSPPSSSRSPESKKLGVHKSHEPPSQEYCETLFTQGDRPPERDVAYQERVKQRRERDGPSPFWAMTAFRTPSDSTYTQEDPPLKPHLPPEDPQLANDPSGRTADSTFCPEDKEEHAEDSSGPLLYRNTVQIEQSVPPKPEETAEAPLTAMKTGSPPVPHVITKRSDIGPCNSPEKVPVNTYESESSQAYTISNTSSKEDEHEISGVLTRSASQESKEEETTPETEDYFSKESTPSDSLASPLYDEMKLEDDSVFMSPSKVRTTEDLFAMIHRSKRKVLGRKDSGELNTRNRLSTGSGSSTTGTPVASPSTPVTPGTPTSSQRPPGPIYRCAKKSSTSNEEFKLLLLKKGSRTDSSYRLSATEILKSPIAPKSPGDPMAEGGRNPEELLSPLQQGAEHLPSPFPRANTEGFSPKTFTTSASSRQGRSRIPPPANSSRYSVRSRLYTAPMQAISEGETENSDGSPHDDRSSQSST